MTKEEMLKVLILLSQMEGYLLGKLGSNNLPQHIEESLSSIGLMLSNYIEDKVERGIE